MIRWIDSALGTAAFGDPATKDHEVLDVRGLVDGRANGTAALRERIDSGLALLRKSERMVVCCDYGISRSNTIAAAILAHRDGLSFDEAMNAGGHDAHRRLQAAHHVDEPIVALLDADLMGRNGLGLGIDDPDFALAVLFQ